MPQNPFQFRGNRKEQTAIGYTRLQFQEQEAEMRERLAFGKHLLEMAQFANKLDQEDQQIKDDLLKEKSISAAGRQLAALDPTDAEWAAKYGKIMTDYPHAHDDKFLLERFQTQSKINAAAVATQAHKEQTQITEESHKRETLLAEESHIREAKMKEKIRVFGNTEEKAVAQYVEKGGSPLDHATYGPDGEITGMDWAGMHAKQGSLVAAGKASIPPESIVNEFITTHTNAEALKRKAAAVPPAEKGWTDAGTKGNEEKRSQGVSAYYEDIIDEKGKQTPGITSLEAKKAMLLKRYPSLGELLPSAPEATDQPQTDPERPTAKIPAAPAGEGQASTFSEPPAGAVDYLKAHPDARPFFEKRYGDASKHLGQ